MKNRSWIPLLLSLPLLLSSCRKEADPPAADRGNEKATVTPPAAETAKLQLRTWNVSDIGQLFQACREAAPGDEIVIAKGVHTIRGKTRVPIVDRPGPVVVRGATGNPADVIIEGQGQDDKSVETIFELTNSPAWTFRDLTTRNSYFHGFKFNGSSADCVLANVVMRDHGESGVKGTSTPGVDAYPDRLLVEKCDIGFTETSGGTRGVVEGIDGVAVNGWIIRGNRFLNVQKSGKAAYGAFTKGNSSGTVIEGNRFENCFIGASFGGGGTGVSFFRNNDTSVEHRGGVIRNNEFIGGTDAAIYLNKASDARIHDNRITGGALNIHLRYEATTAWGENNTSDNTKEPIIRLRDGAKLLDR